MTLRQAVRRMLHPKMEPLPVGDPTYAMVWGWRRDTPEQFAELLHTMGYEPDPSKLPGIVVVPDAFEPGPVPVLPCLLKPSGPTLAELEREAVIDALRRHHGVQARAARDLGISKSVMHYTVQRLGLRQEKRNTYAEQ